MFSLSQSLFSLCCHKLFLFMCGWFCCPDVGGRRFLWNISIYQTTDHNAQHCSLQPLLCEFHKLYTQQICFQTCQSFISALRCRMCWTVILYHTGLDRDQWNLLIYARLFHDYILFIASQIAKSKYWIYDYSWNVNLPLKTQDHISELNKLTLSGGIWIFDDW